MRVSAINTNDHYIGNKNAPITFVVYEDYECEYCEKSFSDLKNLTDTYRQHVCFVYRHFPFMRMHPHAMLAALVVEACGLQNKFMEAHDCIFKNQVYLEYGLGGILRLLEKDYGICIDKLNEDLQKADVVKKVVNDIASGVRCYIKNTPSIFINGERYTGEVALPVLGKVIRRLMTELHLNAI